MMPLLLEARQAGAERLRLPQTMFVLAPATLWSAIEPRSLQAWCFEALPAIGLMIALVVAHRRGWRLTPVAATMLTLGILLILVGAHYTYARMPLFSWLRDGWGLSRNHFDRFGHVFQGAVPAIVLRELLARQWRLPGGRLLDAAVVFICLGISAAWELIEWLAVVAIGGHPDVYLGFQGDPWDSYFDMLCALCGALASVLVLARLHDRQLRCLPSPTNGTRPLQTGDSDCRIMTGSH